MKLIALFIVLVLVPGEELFSQDSSLSKAISQVNQIRNGGEGHQAAIAAWKQLKSFSIDQAPVILKGITADNPLAANWLRAAVDQIAERHVASGQAFPTAVFEKIVFDESYAAKARRMAYEWALQADPDAKSRIIPKMLDSSSLEMRRDAVAGVIAKAEELGEGAAATEQYRIALSAARDFDQVKMIHETLTKRGEKIELQEHFGFLANWQLIGPFDNTDKKGYAVAYPPEAKQDPDQAYVGKAGEVKWQPYVTSDDYGEVDLNEILGKDMGAIAYAFTEFESEASQAVELRLSSKNATKVWVNGELAMANEVYHSGSQLDQYICRVKLKPGKNLILLKVCQNEQTQSWAQDWKFQIRVCDKLGTAIASASVK